ncbi:MAG: D-alanyl-lipoteichoic acid biosynthesis protein DltB [Eggerthellaceae bacterium]|nr:D-alanyl-lipoteichoic acid biosynthesis protein DltB [Eggerthellaceae bacterium]
MGFYTEPAFFIATAVVACIAVVLGVLEKPLHKYGLAASVVMLALLFSDSLPSLVFFLAYLVYSFALERFVERLFRTDAPHAVEKYRIALALQIAPLAVYKVGVVFEPTFLGFVGISYITFKAVQVLIEIRDGLIGSIKPWRYLYFLVFFPTFTSGPILRSRAFEKDLDRALPRDGYLELLYRGAGWFILGALYKFVGSALTGWLMWFAPAAIGGATPAAYAAAQVVYALMYGLNLFFDFAGYSHMAVGVGFALGVEVPRNFRAPFLSVDIKDFWNRWHITLSYWLRDFVFMRFTSAALAHEWFKSTVTTACIAYIVNMLVMGFWHGITVDYVLYGLYHGLLLAACELIQRKWGFYKKHKKDRWFRVCSWAVTMVAVFYGFALFSGQALCPIAV